MWWQPEQRLAKALSWSLDLLQAGSKQFLSYFFPLDLAPASSLLFPISFPGARCWEPHKPCCVVWQTNARLISCPYPFHLPSALLALAGTVQFPTQQLSPGCILPRFPSEGKGQVVPGYSLLFLYISQAGDHRHTSENAVGVRHATVLCDIVLWKTSISIQEMFLKTEIYFPIQKTSIWVTA